MGKVSRTLGGALYLGGGCVFCKNPRVQTVASGGGGGVEIVVQIGGQGVTHEGRGKSL